MYKGSKSKIVKIGGYSLMGFFVIIIVISFGLPSDWMSSRDSDPNTVATVNGEKIHRIDLARMTDRYTGGRRAELPPEQQAYFLNMMINDRIQLQYAKKIGIEVSDMNVISEIRKQFTSPQTNQFDDKYFKRALESVNLSVDGALTAEKERQIQNEMTKLFAYSTVPTKEEIAFQNGVDKASFQVRYAFLSNEDFKKKNGSAFVVTEAEIDTEMNANKKEIENPATDRAKFKDKILDRKLAEAKKTFVAAIDAAASKGDSFDKTAAMLGGKVGTSDAFKAGEQLKEPGKEGKPLFSLSDSEVFRNGFASLAVGTSSRSVISSDGIYLYTPLKKDFKAEMPAEKDLKAVTDKVGQAKQQSIQSSVFVPFVESSKVVRKLKNN